MGRSVFTLPEATLVAHCAIDEYDTEGFDMIIDDYRDQLRDMFPSVTAISKWVGREDHVVAENRHATFGISKYCGLVAYWAVPKTNLAAAWLMQIGERFTARFGQLEILGTASSGETFYRRIK
jgi:hypothetical protein